MNKRYMLDHSIWYSDDHHATPEAAAMNTLAFLRRSGVVRRYHTEELLKPQDVAQHSYGVAWLCWWLCQGQVTMPLIMHALAHDAAEHGLGDIPSPTKRELGIKPQVDAAEACLMEANGLRLPALTTYEDLMLKMADALDGVLHCLHELELGNQTLYQVFLNFHQYGHELLPDGTPSSAETPWSRARMLLDWAATRWSALTK